MNKTLIIVLVVCLISVQAINKRDAPADKPTSDFDDVINTFKESTKDLGNKLSEALQPENIRKNFESITKSISKSFEGLKTKEEPKA